MPRGLKRVMMVFAAVLVGAAAYGGTRLALYLSTPAGRQTLTALRGAMSALAAGQAAPGAAELRRAGCDDATVLDQSGLRKMVSSDQPRDAATTTNAPNGAFVLCMVQTSILAPACDQLAHIYCDAAAPSEPFDLSVTVTTTRKTVCSGRYDPAAMRVGSGLMPSKE